MRNERLSLLLGLFLLAAPAAARPGGGDDLAALERALAAIQADHIRADIRFIASDELEGRDTPSHGQRLAARYLRARLERLGFQPAGDDGFFDRYQLERRALDREASRAWVLEDGAETELRFGNAYAFFGGDAHELEGPVVFVGSGSAEELSGLDLAGSWALAIEEGGGGRRDRRAWQERMERNQRIQAAGALGLLTGSDPAGPGAAEGDAGLARMAGFAGRARLTPPEAAGSEPQFSTLSLASGVVRALVGDGALPAAGTRLGPRFREKRVLQVDERLDLENVAGLWPGSDPAVGKEVIILSAHYDHEGVLEDGQVMNGADDNGSGTCGLLAVAEALVAHGPLRRSVLLLWVSGEEKGLLGSAAWTRDPTLPEGYRPICDINIDMIGRNAPDKLLITPSKAHPESNGLARLAESLAPSEGFPELGSADEFWQRSDHMNFAVNLKIPVAFLFSGEHEDYHKPTDDADKIDCDKIRRVSRLVVRILSGLQVDSPAF